MHEFTFCFTYSVDSTALFEGGVENLKSIDHLLLCFFSLLT